MNQESNWITNVLNNEKLGNISLEDVNQFLVHYKTLEAEREAIAAKKAFNKALCKAQQEVKHVNKSATNTHTKSNYAKLEDVQEASKGALGNNNLFIIHKAQDMEGGRLCISTILGHIDGHEEETTCYLPPDAGGAKNAVHAVASAVTYGKRINLCSILNIAVAGEDDDGNAAGRGKATATAKQVETKPISARQVAHLKELLKQNSKNPQEREKLLLKHFKIKELSKLPAEKYATAEENLHTKK